MPLTQIDKDEELKYRLWSDYIAEFERFAGDSDKEVKTMTYFEWLDFYGLS